MKVSIVSIAKREGDFQNLKKGLKKQSFKDWEFVYSTKRGIPQAWNDAIGKAKGEIIITTDSDVEIKTNDWIKDMVAAVKKYNKNDPKRRTIIKGIEIHPNTPWTWCNVGFYADVLKKNNVNEKFPIVEDTELFSRLRSIGYKGVELPIAPILHERRGENSSILKRSFRYGMLNARVNLRYGFVGFKSVKKKSSNIIKREIVTILSRILYLFGIFVGFISFKIRDYDE